MVVLISKTRFGITPSEQLRNFYIKHGKYITMEELRNHVKRNRHCTILHLAFTLLGKSIDAHPDIAEFALESFTDSPYRVIVDASGFERIELLTDVMYSFTDPSN